MSLRAQMAVLSNLFLSVFLVKNPRNPLVIKEAHPKARIQHVALPSKPAEPPMTTLQRGGNPRPTPAPRSRAPRPSGTPACPGPGLR